MDCWNRFLCFHHAGIVRFYDRLKDRTRTLFEAGLWIVRTAYHDTKAMYRDITVKHATKAYRTT